MPRRVASKGEIYLLYGINIFYTIIMLDRKCDNLRVAAPFMGRGA